MLSALTFADKIETENIEAIAATVVKPEVSGFRSGKTSEGSGTKFNEADLASFADQKSQVVNSSNTLVYWGSIGCYDNDVFVKGKGLSFCTL